MFHNNILQYPKRSHSQSLLHLLSFHCCDHKNLNYSYKIMIQMFRAEVLVFIFITWNLCFCLKLIKSIQNWQAVTGPLLDHFIFTQSVQKQTSRQHWKLSVVYDGIVNFSFLKCVYKFQHIITTKHKSTETNKTSLFPRIWNCLAILSDHVRCKEQVCKTVQSLDREWCGLTNRGLF